MTRALVAALAGIVVLLVSSVAAISYATRDDAPARPVGAPERQAPLAAASSPPAPAALLPPAAMPATAVAPELSIAGTASLPTATPAHELAALPAAAEDAVPRAELTVSRAPSRSGQDALPPATHRARISFRGQMTAGMAEIQKRVSGCARSDAAFKLDLETVANGIRVLDVQPEPGVSTGDDVACARAALMGEIIPAPDAEPGRRWQMPLSVRASR